MKGDEMSGYPRLRTRLKFPSLYLTQTISVRARVDIGGKKVLLDFGCVSIGRVGTRHVASPAKWGCQILTKYPTVISLKLRLQAPHSVLCNDTALYCDGMRLEAEHFSQLAMTQTSVILVSFSQNARLVH
jgi:hypothetical protein